MSISESSGRSKSDDAPRGSETGRQVKKWNQDDKSEQGMDHTIEEARGTKRKPEDEGEREDGKRQESMIVSCLSGEESTRRDIQEALRTSGRYYIGSVEERENKNANMAMDVPTEEDYEQELPRNRPSNSEERHAPWRWNSTGR